MIPIDKGATPDVLTKAGAEFQNEAIACWVNPSAYPRPVPPKDGEPKKRGRQKKADVDPNATPLKLALGKHADLDKNGVCTGFKSALFSDFSFYSHETVKRQLIASHHGKCAFCESFIMSTDYGDVEHYRPKAEVAQGMPGDILQQEKVPEHPGYFWLSQTWENLYLSCKSCNQQFKGNLFDVAPMPVSPNGAALVRLLPAGRSNQETALLLLPAVDTDGVSPRAVLRFNPQTALAEANPQAPPLYLAKAQRTIATVGLNRPRLVQARAAYLVKLRALFLLVAAGGGWMQNYTATPNILELSCPHEPAASAQKALAEAKQPYSEFSALAQDAITEWNRELRLGPIEVQTPMQTRATVFVNSAVALPLAPSLKLVEETRKVSEQQLAFEAAPDTKDLDLRYNAALALYKAAVPRTDQERQEIADARTKTQQLYARIGELEQLQAKTFSEQVGDPDALGTHEKKKEGLEKQQNSIRLQLQLLEMAGQYAAANEGGRQQILGTVGPGYAPTVQQWAAWQPWQRQQAASQLQQQGMESTGVGVQLEEEREKLLQLIADEIAETEYLESEIDLIEQRHLDPRLRPASDVREDMVELADAYRRRGAAAERAKRCDTLQKAAAALEDYLEGEADATDDLKKHMQDKDWPSAFRIKAS